MTRIASFIILLFLPLLAAAQKQYTVYFNSNEYMADGEQLRIFKAWMSANKDSKIVAINGFTDEDGATEFNDTLAQNRVGYIYGLIKENNIKIRDDFKTRSFGELHKHSNDKAKNRRVDIFYIRKDELHRENEILGIAEPVVAKPKKEIVYPEKIVIQNPNGTTDEVVLDKEFMKKLGEAKPGEKLKLDNLNFFENTFAIVPQSRPKLYELLEIMTLHEGLKIKIQGHICCQAGDPRKLSVQRAKAVAMFLQQNGIPKSRMSFEGLGTTQPINPLPEKNEEERAANRRVEILVVENN